MSGSTSVFVVLYCIVHLCVLACMFLYMCGFIYVRCVQWLLVICSWCRWCCWICGTMILVFTVCTINVKFKKECNFSIFKVRISYWRATDFSPKQIFLFVLQYSLLPGVACWNQAHSMQSVRLQRMISLKGLFCVGELKGSWFPPRVQKMPRTRNPLIVTLHSSVFWHSLKKSVELQMA